MAEIQLHDLAERILRNKMAVPAIFFLEAFKPLAGLVHHAGPVLSPFLLPICGADRLHEYTELFSSAENVEKLIARIEDGERAHV